MGTIVVSTASDGFVNPGYSHMRMGPSGELMVVVKKTSGSIGLFTSTNGGTSWTDKSVDLTRTGLQEWSSIDVDEYSHVHIAYRVYESGKDRIFYRRWRRSGTGYVLESETLVKEATAGSAGAVYQGMDLLHCRVEPQSWRIPVAIGYNTGSSRGITFGGVLVYKSGSVWVTKSLLSSVVGGNVTFLHSETPARIQPTLIRNATPTPNLWVSYGRDAVYLVKLPWNASSKRWIGPTQAVQVGTHTAATNLNAMRFEGNYVVIPVINSSSVTIVRRNKTNTAQTDLASPAHPQGVIRNMTISQEPNGSGDFRLYAVGTSTGEIYYVDYTKASSTWGSWVATGVTPVAITTWGVRDNHGVSETNNPGRYDIYHGVSSGGNTYASTRQTISYPPLTPTWVSPANGEPLDQAATVPVDWNFNDVDPNDTQLKYAVRREYDSGGLIVRYFRASDSTWQTTEQENTSAISGVTLPIGAITTAFGPTSFFVKTWDAANQPSSYSTAVTVIPSSKSLVGISSPTTGATWIYRYLTVSWSHSNQSQYRVSAEKTSDPGVRIYDSGWIASTLTSHTSPAIFEDDTQYLIRVEGKNLEGLTSTSDSETINVDFIPPPLPTLLVYANSSEGYITTTITNPAPGGGEPALSYNDLYRREVGDTSDGILIATGLPDDGVFNDYEAASGVNYEYRARAIGVNETERYSAWKE